MQRPKAGWWKEDSITIEIFCQRLDEMSEVDFGLNDEEFTYDVMIGDIWIGLAGNIEEVAPGFCIGFFKIGPSGARYGRIDNKLTLVRRDV